MRSCRYECLVDEGGRQEEGEREGGREDREVCNNDRNKKGRMILATGIRIVITYIRKCSLVG